MEKVFVVTNFLDYVSKVNKSSLLITLMSGEIIPIINSLHCNKSHNDMFMSII